MYKIIGITSPKIPLIIAIALLIGLIGLSSLQVIKKFFQKISVIFCCKFITLKNKAVSTNISMPVKNKPGMNGNRGSIMIKASFTLFSLNKPSMESKCLKWIIRQNPSEMKKPFNNIELQPIIYNKVQTDSIIMSDEWWGYKHLNMFYTHLSVDHSYMYVNRDNSTIHTNTIEEYWSLIKRNIIGIYHYVSKKHMQRYCWEFDFKYNQRKNNIYIVFNNCLYGANMKRLKYNDLVFTNT